MKWLLTLCCIFLCWPLDAKAQPTVAGRIKTLEGQVFILRDNHANPVELEQILFVSDTVTTSKASTVGIMLEDDTLLSLGPDSRLELNSFAFDPGNNVLGMAVRLLKGSFAYMSGVIGRIAPDTVRVETPDAVISTYGTHFVVSVEGEK
ncbi:hypothetical protein MASR1M90_10160 [Desulfovibrionales bacterium]